MRACGTCGGEGWRWVVVAQGEVVRHLVEFGCPECADALELERLRRVPRQRRRPSRIAPGPVPLAPVSPAEGRANRAELLAAVVPLQRRPPVVAPPAGGAA